MIFSLEDFKRFSLGAVKVENKRDAFQFFRFNDAEMAHYAPTTHLKKSYATAGVSVACITDAGAVRISGSVRPGSSRTYYSFDILCDGVLVGQVKNYDISMLVPDYTAIPLDLGEFSGRVELPEGRKRLQIVFPWSVAVDLYELSLDGESFVEPVNTERNMIIYGDSITQGYDAQTPSRSYASRLARELNANALNKGIGGEKFSPDLASIKNDNSPEIITVAYGTNDWSSYTISKLKRLAEEFYSTLSGNYPSAKIFAISPIWRGELSLPEKNESFKKVAEIISDIADKHENITFIDGIDFVPHDSSYYADLRLHPDDGGFDFYADNLIKKIKSYL